MPNYDYILNILYGKRNEGCNSLFIVQAINKFLKNALLYDDIVIIRKKIKGLASENKKSKERNRFK